MWGLLAHVREVKFPEKDYMADELPTPTPPAHLMPGLGRPVGSLNKASKAAQAKLKELGFDPIEELVKMYRQTDQDIYSLTHNNDGTFREKFSQMALASLMTTKAKVGSDLLRYGYARVSELSANEEKSAPGMVIMTTTNVEDFKKAQEMASAGIDDDLPFKGDDE